MCRRGNSIEWPEATTNIDWVFRRTHYIGRFDRKCHKEWQLPKYESAKENVVMVDTREPYRIGLIASKWNTSPRKSGTCHVQTIINASITKEHVHSLSVLRIIHHEMLERVGSWVVRE